MTARCLVVAAIGAGLAGRPARAEPTADAGAHQHHGIFLRFVAGPAGITNTLRVGSSDAYSYQGGGLGVILAVGSALTPSIVFYGEAAYVFVMGSTADGAAGSGARFESLGPGVTYYFPSNLYLGTSLFFSDGSFAGTGLGLGGSAGKEWWVSDRWALGLAGRITMFSTESPEGHWSIGNGAMIVLSASYN